MMLKSVGKLRKKLEEDTAGDFVFTTYPEQHGFRAGATIENYAAIADDIEREVSERYMELPVDADGVPIRVGDKVIYSHDGVRTVMTETVRWIATGEHETHITTDRTSYSRAEFLCHHHELTVEDVLREFAEGLGVPVADSYVAACAKKLRLAGDDHDRD